MVGVEVSVEAGGWDREGFKDRFGEESEDKSGGGGMDGTDGTRSLDLRVRSVYIACR